MAEARSSVSKFWAGPLELHNKLLFTFNEYKYAFNMMYSDSISFIDTCSHVTVMEEETPMYPLLRPHAPHRRPPVAGQLPSAGAAHPQPAMCAIVCTLLFVDRRSTTTTAAAAAAGS
ncbi:hypothetical protein EON66_04345 [archaeon]|nr:MAG: hypothetical protein EON66_04345 [archaeon]